MKESAFRTSVLRGIPKHVHAQPNPATFMGCAGTPDHYFDYQRDLWVEWKVLRVDDKLPKAIPEESLPSPPQRLWLARRYEAGGNAVVIVGVKLRARAWGVVLESPEQWSRRLNLSEYQPLLRPSAELAAYIVSRVTKE